MQKNKLNLHIYGIHLLNPYKTVVSHLNTVEAGNKVKYFGANLSMFLMMESPNKITSALSLLNFL